MARKKDYPVTQATRYLKQNKVEFIPRMYNYVDKGGTSEAARQFQEDEFSIIKTLVMEDETGKAFIITMHGNREVSLKALARIMGVKGVTPCSQDFANKQTGYMIGGTSPFGTRKKLPVYAEETIFDLPRILINGGKRGFLLEIDPMDLKELLEPVLVKVGR